MNRIDRLFSQILLLQSRRIVTAEEMANRFGLSVRTIYRDLAALAEAGVPITAESGVGYRLMKGFTLPPVNFTAEEASSLVTGGMLVEQFTDSSLKAQMQSALLKVRAILPHDYQERLSRLERGLTTTANVKAPIQADLNLLQQALTQRQVLRFLYRGARQSAEAAASRKTCDSSSLTDISAKSEIEERTVEPMGLIFYLARWHLIGWCRTRNGYRDFRTDRINNLTVLQETFIPREDFHIDKFIRDSMPAPKLNAKVRFTPLAADRAKREWWLGVVDEHPKDDGIVLTLATVDWRMLTAWLLSFGRDATVLAPVSLRKLLVEAAEKAVAHHRAKVS
jgi:predicted DNA-binding transcriptional regulator YafY